MQAPKTIQAVFNDHHSNAFFSQTLAKGTRGIRVHTDNVRQYAILNSIEPIGQVFCK